MMHRIMNLNVTSSLVAVRELEAEENVIVVRYGQSVVSVVTFCCSHKTLLNFVH